LDINDASQRGESLFVRKQAGKELETHYRYMNSIPIFKEYVENASPEGLVIPEFQIMHCAFFSHGYLMFITYEPVPEAHDIFIRFAKVFEQTYTRFLDLQKAEAQAREAKIEAALERTRTQSMIMQHSNELDDVLRVFHEQVLLLGIHSAFSFLWLPDEEKDRHIFWAAWGEDQNNSTVYKSKAINYPLDRNEPATAQCLVDWKGNEPIVSYHVPPAGVENYFAAWQELIYGVEQLKPEYFTDGLYYVEAFMKYGCFGVMGVNDLTEDEKKILGRFAVEFERTYTRFLDLQKAEAQTREAQIETSMEKVRSRSLAMQKPKELTEVAELLRNEMGHLGVEELETSSIYIVDKENEQVECWYAIKDIREENKQLVSDEMAITFAETWVGSEMEKFYRSKKHKTSIVMKDDNRKEWINYCAGKSKVLQGYYGDEIPERTYHLVKFNGGYMGAASPGDISTESWDLLRRAAVVFSLAYTRFNDLQIAEAHALQAEQDLIAIKEAKQKAEEALTELQATQKQLIQSEKMASLGELTAGIAHEIQNPLNFVNNFSEVSKELLDEMKVAIEKGDTEDAKEIMNDVIQNLEKINHHGKRADGIVKGMLQHSSSGSGKKEPTNINTLADEYLRLAYHGLRAKDKSFNATIKTEFEEGLEKVNVIPQDIGRVILNLITNAFYVVNEKGKQNIAGYEPTVEVSTKKDGNKVFVSVKDNGNGIPQKILDKIFQPFFTTKPTGQGTGLGLSLSYDIVKAHGGELRVETKEEEGSTFTITLPIN
jgi:signal transduction histidine kinase